MWARLQSLSNVENVELNVEKVEFEGVHINMSFGGGNRGWLVEHAVAMVFIVATVERNVRQCDSSRVLRALERRTARPIFLASARRYFCTR